MKVYFKNLLRLLGSILRYIFTTIWHYIRMYVRCVVKREKEMWELIVTIVAKIVNRR